MSARPGDPLRVVQLGMGWDGEQPGGLNRVFRQLHEHLTRRGHHVRGLVAGSAMAERESGGAVRAFAPADAPYRTRVRGVAPALQALLTEADDTVLVAHFAPYALGALAAARRHPLVVYFHGPWADESRREGRGALSAWFRRQMERRVYRRAHACVVLSRAFGEILVRDYGVDPARVHVIPGGVDTSRFAQLPTRGDARRALGWDTVAPTVLAVRRLVRRTGIDRLIEAAQAVRARVPAVRVLIAGDGPERERLQAQVRAAGLEGTVVFLGFVPEDRLPLAYRAADVTVVPSVALEGFGLIVAESLAAGTPVLVTPVGGLPEVVRDLDPRLVLRDATAPSIAAGLEAALGGALVLPDAAACAAFARARYDWTRVAQELEQVLRAARLAPAGSPAVTAP